MLVHHHSSIQPNVGLADLSGVAKVFYHLRFRFYPVEFADLCTLIDEIILRDHIVLVSHDGLPASRMSAVLPLTLIDRTPP